MVIPTRAAGHGAVVSAAPRGITRLLAQPLIFILLVARIQASTDVPFPLAVPKTPQDAAAINQDFRALSDVIRKNNLLNGGTIAGTLNFSGAGSGITFSDGSTETRAFSSYASTRTFLPANTTVLSNATIGVAVAGSTVTLVATHTARHRITFNAVIRQSNAGDHVQCGFLQNGNFIDGQSASQGVWVGQGQGTPSFYDLGPAYVTQNAQAPGTYNYSLVCRIDADSYQVCSNALAAAGQLCFFRVEELVN